VPWLSSIVREAKRLAWKAFVLSLSFQMSSGQTTRMSSKLNQTSRPGTAVGGDNIISQADMTDSLAIHFILFIVLLTTILTLWLESAGANYTDRATAA
jgi:hypothetical protein